MKYLIACLIIGAFGTLLVRGWKPWKKARAQDRKKRSILKMFAGVGSGQHAGQVLRKLIKSEGRVPWALEIPALLKELDGEGLLRGDDVKRSG